MASGVETGTILLQTLPVEGDGGLMKGGFTSTMTAARLLEIIREINGIDKDEPVNVIGIGATESLGDEITYMGDKLYVISGEGGAIQTKELDPKTKISFSQIALQPKNAKTQTYHFDHIAAPHSDKDAHEINHGGAFGELLKQIGGDSSKIVHITAKTKYIKSRAVCPVVAATGRKMSPAVDLGTMIKGGEVTLADGTKSSIMPQTIKDQHFAEPQEISLAGIITGKNMLENLPLQGLHVHCEHGHVLDLGNLHDVNVKVTPIERTIIRTIQKDKDGKAIWRNALEKVNFADLAQEAKLATSLSHVEKLGQKNQDMSFISIILGTNNQEVMGSWVQQVINNTMELQHTATNFRP